MSHPTRHYGGLLSGLMIVLFSFAGAGANNTYTIESFIPEYFTDTRLRVSTSLSLSSGDFKESIFSEPRSYYVRDDYESNSDSKNFNLGGEFRYRYETIPKYLDVNLYLTGRYYDYGYESSSGYTDTTDYSHRYSGESDENYYEISFEPHLDGGYYLQDDFFVSAVASANIGYRDYPEDFYKSANRNLNRSPDGYVNDYLYSDESTASYDTEDFYISLQLMPGWGRVYEGRFASTAMYIIDELRENNLLIVEPTDEQMKTLSDIIYKDLLRHYFDYRIYRIEALQAITDYLLAQNLIADANVYQHFIIQDVWEYYPKNSRRFGFKVRAGFGLEFMHYKESYTVDFKNRDHGLYYHVDTLNDIDTLWINSYDGSRNDYFKVNNTYPFIGGELTYYKPYDHRWQINLSGSARYYLGAATKLNSEETYYAVEDPAEPDTTTLIEREIELTGFYSLAAQASVVYLPSSRTSMTFSAQTGLYGFGQEVTEHLVEDSITTDYTFDGPDAEGQFWYSFLLSINYRISIPTSLSLRVEYNSGPYDRINISRQRYNYWNAAWLVSQYDDYERLSYNISAGFSHYIF